MPDSTPVSRASRKRSRTIRPAAALARVATAFTELDEAHRVVLSLHYLERLSLAEIADVLDDTEESVKSVYAEAVRLLKGRKSPSRGGKRAA